MLTYITVVYGGICPGIGFFNLHSTLLLENLRSWRMGKHDPPLSTRLRKEYHGACTLSSR